MSKHTSPLHDLVQTLGNKTTRDEFLALRAVARKATTLCHVLESQGWIAYGCTHVRELTKALKRVTVPND